MKPMTGIFFYTHPTFLTFSENYFFPSPANNISMRVLWQTQQIAVIFILSIFFFFSFQSQIKYKPGLLKSAGFVPSHLEAAKVIQASNPTKLVNWKDGDLGTFWSSNAILPDGFITNPNSNILLNNSHWFDLKNSKEICDGDLNNASFIAEKDGISSIICQFPEHKFLQFLSLKLQAKMQVEVYVILGNGERLLGGIYKIEENFQLKRWSFRKEVKAIQLISSAPFSVFEMAALGENPKEVVIVDLLEKRKVGRIVTKNYSGGNTIKESKYFVSNDQQNWEEIGALKGEFSFPFTYRLPGEQEGRYFKVEMILEEKDWLKPSVFEIEVYDKYGPYGPMPTASRSPSSLKEMLGVNGYWGWGHNSYSSMLKSGQGADLYQPLSSHARNYHDLSWDLQFPDQPIDFSKMATNGTPAKEWLDWDREYKSWVDSGMEIQATIQFYRFKDKEWKTPYQSAYKYGYAYAKHFGSAQGNGYVCAMEVGNEPWQYDAKIYRQILLGMSKGAKAADPNMEIFPCALQATNPHAEKNGPFKNYIGDRIPKEAIPYLDGINLHAYSYLLDENGKRKSTYPEHQSSTFWEVLNAIEWRNQNMPNKKIYLTEWGYDGDGGGENCIHSECLEEAAVANYSLRTLLICSRLGLDRATWYFFADSEEQSSLFTRSGLTGSKRTNFKKKEVYYVLENLIAKYGELHFSAVLQETSKGWVYLFEDKKRTKKYLIAWMPIDYQQRRLTETFELPKGFQVLNAELLQPVDFNFDKNKSFTSFKSKNLIYFSAIPVIFEVEK